jgi:valyl-tRNA synthetase
MTVKMKQDLDVLDIWFSNVLLMCCYRVANVLLMCC